MFVSCLRFGMVLVVGVVCGSCECAVTDFCWGCSYGLILSKSVAVTPHPSTACNGTLSIIITVAWCSERECVFKGERECVLY